MAIILSYVKQKIFPGNNGFQDDQACLLVLADKAVGNSVPKMLEKFLLYKQEVISFARCNQSSLLLDSTEFYFNSFIIIIIFFCIADG